MFAFTELPEDNSIYGEFYGRDGSGNGRNIPFARHKTDFDNFILREPIFHLNRQINLNYTRLITEIAKKAFEQIQTYKINRLDIAVFESFIGARNLKKGEIALGIGPQIITRVRFLINVYNDRLKQKEDDQTHLLQTLEQKIEKLEKTLEQTLEKKMDLQQLRFQKKIDQHQLRLEDQQFRFQQILDQQHKESMARIQVLETMILKYIVDK